MCVIYATKSSENFKNVAVGNTKEFEQNFGRREQNLPIYKWRKKKVGVVNIHGPMLPGNTCKTRRIKDQISQV